MKKILMILFVLILFLPVIEAKVVNITKTDFYVEPTQIYRLDDGDGISFIKDNKEYVITVDEIGKTIVRLKSFGYKDNVKETFYLTVSERFNNRIDFEKDNVYDMKIGLIDIVSNETKVELLFEALNEPKSQENTQESFSKPLINSETKTGLIIASLIIIIGLLIYFGIKKKSTKTKKEIKVR